MKTTLQIAAFALTSLGLAAFAQAAPAGKAPNPTRYHLADSHKPAGNLLKSASCCARCSKCGSADATSSQRQVRIGGKRNASAKKA